MNDLISRMIDSHPDGTGLDRQALAACVAACVECAQACTACADACLGEETVADMRRCIRSDLDCADVCQATGRVLSRQTAYDAELTRAVLRACAEACKTCGDECARHADMHEHCRICADACRRCEQACNDLLATIGEHGHRAQDVES